jgi:hypothetical protein
MYGARGAGRQTNDALRLEYIHIPVCTKAAWPTPLRLGFLLHYWPLTSVAATA